MTFITVFTPTYNRAYSLPKLYKSLVAQPYTSFEWLIVDDGSTDNTEQLVGQWLQEKRVDIRYYKQPNGGKHRATNKAVSLAKGELFFFVDSDDYITKDSLTLIDRYYEQVRADKNFAGVAAYKAYPNGQRVAEGVAYDVIDTDVVSFFQEMKGDMTEIWRTEVLKAFPFPEFPGEKFVTEAVVWNEIAKKYKLRYFNANIYVCEYLDDGLSNNLRKHHRQSPQGTMLYYSNLVRDSRFGLRRHIIDAINFWRYLIPYKGRKTKLPWWCYMLKPLGFLFYLLDLLHERNSHVNHREVKKCKG